MKKNFELFLLNESIDSEDVKALENHLGFLLPPFYKTFMMSFKLGKKYLNRAKAFFEGSPSYGINPYYINLTTIVLEINGITKIRYFDYFYDKAEIIACWDINSCDDRFQKYKLLPIGYFGEAGSAYLCVGYGEDNMDNIIGVLTEGNEDEEDFPFIIENYVPNIFSFVSYLKESDEELAADAEPIYLF
jgi:hypothetical protein